MAKVPDRYLEERRSEILAAAASVFRERGYSDATMQEIAHRCDLAAGSIYRYFDDKGHLIAAVAASCFDQDFALYSASSTEGISPLAALVLIGEHVRAGLVTEEWRDQAVLRLESYLAAERDAVIREELLRGLTPAWEGLAGVIRAAQTAGEMAPDVDAEALTTLLHGIGSGLATMRLLLRDRIDTDAAWALLVRMLAALLTADGLNELARLAPPPNQGVDSG